METSQNHYSEILPCYLEGGDMQPFAEQLGESQAETENTPTPSNSQ